MNVSRLLSVLLVLVALVVLVVALVFFFEKKKQETKEEDAATSTTTTAGEPVSAMTLNVVTFLKANKVEELRSNPDLFLLDARAKTNYQSKNVPVTVVSSELENLFGYTKHTHTLSTPFKADGLVFDGLTNYRFFPQPLVGLTAYMWNTTVLFLTFKTVNDGGAALYYHFVANPSVEGLNWTSFQHDPNLVLDHAFLAPKLEEVNTNLGNLVALSLDEFVDANAGTYNTELGGVRTTFNLLKRPYTQTDYVKLTHKLLETNTNVPKAFQLKKVLVSGTELNDLVLPNKPLHTVSVFWWYNVPLLAELEFVTGNKEHFVYNAETNNWTNDVVDKVRAKLTVLKNKLGVPLNVDLSKAPSSAEETYTTNEVVVRVSPNTLTNNAFPSFTHRFSTGQPHFVGNFVNAGTPQSGLPSLRVNELTVFFSNGVPLVLKMDLSGVGSLGTKHLFFSNNGFGFWSKFPLTQEFATPEAVLNKLDAENKKLVAANDKYVVDVFSKSDYLSVGKLFKVAQLSQTLKDYTAYTHKANGDVPFKFEKLVFSGKDVKVTGLEELTGVNAATVYWFLDNPLFVKLEGTKTVPATTPTVPPAPPSSGTSSTGTQGGQQQTTSEYKYFFSYNGETKEWKKVEKDLVADDAKLKTVLDKARATFGSATVNVGHGVGTYVTGPVTVTVNVLKPHETDTLAALDVMVHEFSTSFLLGKLKHFDFDMKLTHTATETTSTASTQTGNGAGQQQQTTKTVPFALEGLVVKRVDVFVFKYVPLLFKLYVEGGNNLVFTNTYNDSTWHKFSETPADALRNKLTELKSQLTAASSMDVCRDLKDNESVTYELPRTVGGGKVPVTLTRAQPTQGLQGVTHTLGATDVKLTSLTCGDRVLTGLNLDQVQKVSVFTKAGSVALVKTNSDPKFFVAGGDGTLSRHVLPQGTTDLNADQLGQLLTQVSDNLGPVLPLNLEAKETYTSANTSVLVDLQPLGGEWNLYVHHLPPRPPAQTPASPPVGEVRAPVPEHSPRAPVSPHFTVSKFLQGQNTQAVGLPLNNSYTDVYAVLKGNVPHLLGLKSHPRGDFEWFVFNKYRWLPDFTSKDMLENDDLLTLAKELTQGLDNEFDLDLSTELQNEAFLLEQHEFTHADKLEGFTFQTYTPLDNKYPVLLNTLTFNGNLLSVPFLQSYHLNGFTLYLFHGEPVFLHAFTLDNKFLFFENGFEGEWKLTKLEEFTKETLKGKLTELKNLAVKFVTLNLHGWNVYRSFGERVNVEKVETEKDTWAPFNKFVHKLSLPPAETGKNTTETEFKVSRVLFNGVDLKFTLPKGTVTSAVVFATDDQVPVGLYLKSTVPVPPQKPAETPNQQLSPTAGQTPPQPAPQAPSPSPTQAPEPQVQQQTAQPTGGSAVQGETAPPTTAGAQNPSPSSPVVQNVVTYNYFFNKAGNWEKLAENKTELATSELKKKLDEALTSLGFYVEVDLGQKLPYLFTKTVSGETGPKVVDFLVQFNPKDTFNFSTYTHVAQVRATTQGSTKTTDVYPLVTHFTLYGQRLRGFDLNKVLKFTVFWLHDKFPLMVYVTTPLQHKFYRNTGDNNWSLLKAQLEQPTNSDLFRALALAKQSFTFDTNVEMGTTEFPGFWYKYRDGQVTLKVTKLPNLTEYNVFSHTSVTAGFPTFFLGNLNLWGRPVYGGLSFWFVHEVRVFTDTNKLPLMVEVVHSKFNTPKSPLMYSYLTFDTNPSSDWFFRLTHEETVRLNNDSLTNLLKSTKESMNNLAFLKLDAKASYNTDQSTVTVVNEEQVSEDTKFKSFLHKHEAKLYVLLQNDKRVGFDYLPAKFNSAKVFWLGGVPVYVKFHHTNQDNTWSHYFHWPNGTWHNTLPFEFNLTGKSLTDVLKQVLKLHYEYYTLDLGTKTVTSAFGDDFELDLVEYRHANVTFPEELVGYSLLPFSHEQFKLVTLKVFGFDFKDFYLTVPTGRVVSVHVYSPDAFYAPLFLELVSVEPNEHTFAEPKLRYDYFHATQSGNWAFLNTDGLRLDPAHLGFKLAAFANPVPSLVDLGKRDGVYGLNELTVTKVPLPDSLLFTKYVHKLSNSESFLTAKWLYNGLLVKNLPTLKATHVTVYFYHDVVPLLVEVNTLGLVKFFSQDFNGNWTPDLVAKNSVLSYLNYLVHDLNLSSKTLDEWVPQLNFKLLREFELVPPEPVPVTDKEGPLTQTPVSTAPASGAAKETTATEPPTKPTDSHTSTPSTEPGTPVAHSVERSTTPAGTNTTRSPLTTVAVSPNLATTASPGTVVEGGRVVTTETTGVSSVATSVESVGTLASRETTETVATAKSEPGTTGQPTQTPEDPTTSPLKVPTPEQVPVVKPVDGTEALSGAKAGVVPLVPPVTKAVRPKRKFRLAPLDYDKLFNGYLTMSKFVGVTRFETVPPGYRFARHTLLNQDAKHVAEKFFVGDKLYKLPDDYLAATPAKNRKPNMVGFYSYLNDPLLLKLGFEGKKPDFFAFNRDEDAWKKHEVVNLEEELENLNHNFNRVVVFDLGKKPLVHHPYYNGTTYYVSTEDSLDSNLFKVQEYETFYKVVKQGDERQTYEQLPFKLGKLRHNAVDLPVDGLPLGKVFYTLRVHFSKLLDKPLVLVLYPDQDEKDRKRFERENPGKYLGYHYHLNVDNTWSFFVPEGVDALLNKLKELESSFKEPPALDLARVTGTDNSLKYWTENDHFVVEKLFLPPPTATKQAQTPPNPAPPTQPPTGNQQPSPAPQAQPSGNQQGTPASVPTTPPQPQGTPSTATEGQAQRETQAPADNRVDPLLGLEEKTTTLPTDAVFTEVPLVPFLPATGSLPASGFEWFHHHTPFFVQNVPVTPPKPAETSPQKPTPDNALQGTTNQPQTPSDKGQQQTAQSTNGPKVQGEATPSTATPNTRKVVKVKRFHLGKVLNLGVPLNFELPFERLANGWAGLTVLYEKNWNTPFLFALFNPKDNSPNLENAFYDVWVFKNMKWVKTAELEGFYSLFRSFELRHDLEKFNDLVPKFYTKLTELSNQAKAPQTHSFTLDLVQANTVTQGDVVVNKSRDDLLHLNLSKLTFTPKLATPRAGWVDFTLNKVTFFLNDYFGLDLPLVGVTEVNVFLRTNPAKFTMLPTVLELVQKLPRDGNAVFKYWYYVYEDGNVWKLHMTTSNKLSDHEVLDLINFKLFEYYRLSLLHENSLVLDLDTKFSHLSLGRFVDSVGFVHDPTPNAPYSPVPEGFVLFRHSMVTEETNFYLPFLRLNGVLKKTPFKWPFVQYFVYYKVGDSTPFVVVLAKANNLKEQPTHQWYYVKDDTLVRFVFESNTDVDPDAKNVKEVVAKKFKELLATPPSPLEQEDPWTVEPKGDTLPTFPKFPETDNRVLSDPSNGVVPEPESRKGVTNRRSLAVTEDFKSFLEKPKRKLVA